MKRRFFRMNRMLALILACCLALTGCSRFTHGREESTESEEEPTTRGRHGDDPTESEEHSGYPQRDEDVYAVGDGDILVGVFSDEKIRDEEEAIAALQAAGKEYPALCSASAELEPVSTYTSEDENLTWYRLQQTCQGVPVAGAEAVIITDGKGNGLAVSSTLK